MTKNDALIRQAILKAFELGTAQAAPMFGMEADELLEYQQTFLELESKKLNPQPTDPDAIILPKNVWEQLRTNKYYDVALKVGIATILIAICWRIPVLLAPLLDPLTNTVVWLGFTSAYLTMFAGLIIDMIFYVQHPANFNFLNPFIFQGSDDDYQTLLYSDQLSAYQKCALNQRKYMFYLFAYCAILLALANLTTGGGN